METLSASEFNPVERAEAVMGALQEKTDFILMHKGARACYLPELDDVRLLPKKNFNSVYDYYATVPPESTHSTSHAKRLY